MRKRIQQPSPALVVACLALFVAMGGVGYAATKINGKNIKNKTIAGKKLKNKTITGGKVKDRSLTGATLKDNTIGASQIDESKLGTVPKAATADNATNAANALNATNAANAATAANVAGRQRIGIKRVVATPGASSDAARLAAPEVPLFVAGPFTIYGKCFTDLSGVTTNAFTFVKTTEGGSVLHTDHGGFEGDPFLEPSTPEIDRRGHAEIVSPNDAHVDMVAGIEISGMAPDGTSFEARIPIAVKNGNLPGGNGIFGPGDVCLFSGQLDQFN